MKPLFVCGDSHSLSLGWQTLAHGGVKKNIKNIKKKPLPILKIEKKKYKKIKKMKI